jgi:hypothetical protein
VISGFMARSDNLAQLTRCAWPWMVWVPRTVSRLLTSAFVVAQARRLRLWGSKNRPELLTCGDPPLQPSSMIANVSLRLLYLIFNRLLSW